MHFIPSPKGFTVNNDPRRHVTLDFYAQQTSTRAPQNVLRLSANTVVMSGAFILPDFTSLCPFRCSRSCCATDKVITCVGCCAQSFQGHCTMSVERILIHADFKSTAIRTELSCGHFCSMFSALLTFKHLSTEMSYERQ